MMTQTPSDDTITRRIRNISARIASATRNSGRKPGSVTLVAVSKKQPEHRIKAALAAGLDTFGESRVQEGLQRWGTRNSRKNNQITVHLVGPLQTNKAQTALETFDVVESLDRPKLARALAEAGTRNGTLPNVYVQINTGQEPQKSGVTPDQADAFITQVRDVFDLNVRGLMCIPPLNQAQGPHFALLAKIAARNGLDQLSMGMSADFETAIAFGATSVRIGTALFGERQIRNLDLKTKKQHTATQPGPD